MTGADLDIVRLSLKVSLAALLGALPVAFGIAWVIARTRWRGRFALDALAQLPLVLPPVVTGWLLLMLLGRNGPIGAALYRLAGIILIFRWTGAAIAAGIMALPLMVRALRLGLEAVDRRQEEVARTLGARRWQVLARVTLPLAMPGVLAALVLGFARSLSEFGATITFVSNIPGETETLPLAIYSALQVPGSEARVARLAAISVGLAVLSLGAAELISRRSRNGDIHKAV